MTRIILVRHGQVDWLAPERFRGHAELPLVDRGRPRTLDALEQVTRRCPPMTKPRR